MNKHFQLLGLFISYTLIACAPVQRTTYSKFGETKVDDRFPRHQYNFIPDLAKEDALNNLAKFMDISPSEITLTPEKLTSGNDTWQLSDIFQEKVVFLSGVERCKKENGAITINPTTTDGKDSLFMVSILSIPNMKKSKEYYYYLFNGILIYGKREYDAESNAKRAIDILYTAYSGKFSHAGFDEPFQSQKDIEYRLKKLKKLYDQGLLDKEEYRSKKKEILNEF